VAPNHDFASGGHDGAAPFSGRTGGYVIGARMSWLDFKLGMRMLVRYLDFIQRESVELRASPLRENDQ
jgi:hypothetical protein